MATREGNFDHARREAARMRSRLGDEMRRARRGAGLSLDSVGRACHLSASQVSRIEKGSVRQPSLEEVICIADVVGLDVVIRTFPRGDPIRDAGHARLLERLRIRLRPGLSFRTEVPLPIVGDLRAWDAVVGGEGWQVPVEAETVIDDGQALQRKLALKLRDGGFDHLILLVVDTPRNRAALEATPLREAFPLHGRSILGALRGGRDPGANGVVIL